MSEQTKIEARQPRHPIRVAARRTGISLHVLRAWERRYGVVAPGRTGGGQRLYSDADIARLRLLRQAVEAGWPISRAAELDERELAQVLSAEGRTEAPPAPGGHPLTHAADATSDAAGYLAASLDAAAALDPGSLRRVLLRGMVTLRPQELLEGVVGPLLTEVGERWHRGELTPAHEHAASVVVRGVLEFLLGAYQPEADAPVLVSTTLAGELHEFGVLLASVLAAEAGWRVLYLGPSLPVGEIVRAAAGARARAVAVSVVDERRSADLTAELGALRERLPARVRLLVGGRAALAASDALAAVPGVETGSLELLGRALPRAGLAEVLA